CRPAPANVASRSAPGWCGPRSASSSPRATRQRASSTSVVAPAASPYPSRSSVTGSRSSIPAPTLSQHSTGEHARLASPTGSPASRVTSPTWLCSSRPTTPDPSTWCSATACSTSSRIPLRGWRPSPPCSELVGTSACSWPSGMPPWWPGRWPGTSRRLATCWTTPRPAAPRGEELIGSPSRSSRRCSPLPDFSPRPSTVSGSSPTSCRARWSISSRGRAPRSSSWRAPLPGVPNTSRSRPSCTCSPPA
ncbi:MAG: Ubiquinone biosynthesis SAM-dependent O-methyltransferase, partial [uncultured Nocardioides sp.]